MSEEAAIRTGHPWQGAEIHEGTIPQQATMYPRPVVLECGQCHKPGYWYPAEDRIDTGGRMCFGETPPRPYHQWDVYSWNGNEPVSGITAADEEEQ